MVTEETQEFKDPWTRKLIEDPVTNKVCGHTYERSTVERFLNANAKSRKPLKCPVVGCPLTVLLYTDITGFVSGGLHQ